MLRFSKHSEPFFSDLLGKLILLAEYLAACCEDEGEENPAGHGVSGSILQYLDAGIHTGYDEGSFSC